MKPNWGGRLLGLFTLLSATAGVVSAQGNFNPKVLPKENPSQTGVLPCKAGTNFETEGYRIAHTSLDDPFKFLYWIGAKTKTIQAQLKARLNNQLFTYKLVDADALSLIENARFAPDSEGRFALRVELVSVQNCDPKAKTLDLIYRIYSTDPPKVLGGATESQTTAEKSPQITTGLTKNGNPYNLTPSGGYNRSYDIFGGGRVQITPILRGSHLFDTFTAEGEGSSSMHSGSLALSGSATYHGWLRHSDWRFNYQNYSVPAGATRLENADLSGQLDSATRPFWNNTTFVRFGGLLQGGNMQSGALPSELIPPQTISNAGYGSLKAFFGLSSRTSRNVFSVSYGLELGSVGPSAQIDWRKHIGDVVDEFWIPIGDHKPLEVESRFTIGSIQVPHSIPLPARFFGGNGEQFFVPGDSWQIRDVPVIRAIPANRFYLTGEGTGADSFTSVNLTFAYPVKSHPIMPRDLSTDPEFNKLLQAQIVSATSIEQNYYSWKDIHFGAARNRLPDLKQLLDNLQKAVGSAESTHPGRLQDQFSDCTSSIEVAAFDVTNTLAASGAAQYGDLSALLPVDSDDLKSVQDACVRELNQQLADPGIQSAAAAVDSARTAIQNEFNAIDQTAAAQKAASDIAFVKRTLNTLFKDLNIFSVSPVAVFDTASIGPAKGALGGNRIGPGGGIRLELVSYVNFTLGYAWNVNRQPSEGQGALFFSINVRDLFH
jgi:hypothetical protein